MKDNQKLQKIWGLVTVYQVKRLKNKIISEFCSTAQAVVFFVSLLSETTKFLYIFFVHIVTNVSTIGLKVSNLF